MLAAVRERIIGRLQAQGYTISQEPALALVVNGRALRPSAVEGQVYRFDLPETVQEARLVSRAGVPSGTAAGETDCRRLGVCVGDLMVRRGEATVPVTLENPALEGFHPLESNATESWRWTNGEGILPASLLSGGGSLEVRLLWPGAYWVAPEHNEAARATA